jgi:hypothetical protein
MSVQMIKVPELRRYGVGDLNRLMPYILGGKVASGVENYGNEFKDLHKGSITLGNQAGHWNAYLMSELGELDLGDAKDAIYSQFENRGNGNVTDDACNYDGGIKLRKFKDSDRSVEWIIRPEGFEKKNGIWQAKLGQDSDLKHITIPASGYVALTCDGSYRPDTGTPFKTVPTRAEAEKSWTDAGYTSEFAKKSVSYFYSMDEGKGTASVFRWCNDGAFGRFYVDARNVPDIRDSDIGALAASGAERSEAGTAKGTIVLLENEYRMLTGKAGKFDAMKKMADG